MSTPIPNAEVIFQRLADGSGVLVDAEGNSYAINATGADVWELCDGRRSADEICDVLLDRYEATPELVQESLDAMLTHLAELKLLTLPGASDGGRAPE
jgi:hypothetical protein